MEPAREAEAEVGQGVDAAAAAAAATATATDTDTAKATKRRLMKLGRQLLPAEPRSLTLSAAGGGGGGGGGVRGGGDANAVVVVDAVRTPIGRAKKGCFKDVTPDILLEAAFSGLLRRNPGVRAAEIGDIVVGNVLQPGSGAVMARMAQFQAGIPYEVPLTTINRQCSSGLQAFAVIASHIHSGFYDIGLAGGVESMSCNDMADGVPDVNWELVNANKHAKDCVLPMGITNENIAAKYGITREQQDSFAARSQSRAARAQEAGEFADEIVPVTIENDDGNGSTVVHHDDGIRPGTTVEKLARLRPSFKADGSTTAGNSSQVSDGAAAVLVTKRSVAEQNGWAQLGVFRSFAVVGVEPKIMGVGPAYAIPRALEQAGLRVADIDVFEVNEAFAAQCLWCAEHLGIPAEKLNPNGGAIALGHPLGCTGARQIATMLHYMNRRRLRYGVISMCIGTGMGAAAVFENPNC